MSCHAADGEFRRVLCVAAHPDDVEYGTSAAVAAWTARGVDVTYLLLTTARPEMMPSHPIAQRSCARTTTRRRAAVGVSKVDFLDYPDGVLEYGLGLEGHRTTIRDLQPDVVSWAAGMWSSRRTQQADHRVRA